MSARSGNQQAVAGDYNKAGELGPRRQIRRSNTKHQWEEHFLRHVLHELPPPVCVPWHRSGRITPHRHAGAHNTRIRSINK